ncbi:MAG: hypothetical protein JW891_01985 [Candidatus Lokiarchaeota archaeon]|nr:hypothetical protein [Candidatus Lokiarchaeota archaeon]
MVEIINYLGIHLAQLVQISPLAARGLIKLAIKDELGPYFQFDKIKFQELKLTISNSLKIRIQKLKNIETDKVIKKLEEELIENQSLITMSKV